MGVDLVEAFIDDAQVRYHAARFRRERAEQLGVPDGSHRVPFDHAVVTAYVWSVDALTEIVQRVGLSVTGVAARHDPPARPQGFLVAHRTA